MRRILRRRDWLIFATAPIVVAILYAIHCITEWAKDIARDRRDARINELRSKSRKEQAAKWH